MKRKKQRAQKNVRTPYEQSNFSVHSYVQLDLVQFIHEWSFAFIRNGDQSLSLSLNCEQQEGYKSTTEIVFAISTTTPMGLNLLLSVTLYS